jgi:hypothetical protein
MPRQPRRFTRATIGLTLVLALSLLVSVRGVAFAAPAQTGQGIFVNLQASGDFIIAENQVWKFNDSFDTVTDVNGNPVAGVGTYFTNAWNGNSPAISCTGGGAGGTNCASANQPATPTAPASDPSKVIGPPGHPGCAETQDCTFWTGGTLTGSTYTQSVTGTGNGLNGKGNWTFTYTYVIAPDPSKDTDSTTDGVQVAPKTAWYLFQDNTNTVTAAIDAVIAGESVVKNTTNGTKYSFSLNDSTTTNRVQNLVVTVNEYDSATSAYDIPVYSANPSSTVVTNASGALYGQTGAVDFCYTTNAGSNGNTSLLLNGDARSILNGASLSGPEPCTLGTQTTTTSPDTFAGNNNGGADGPMIRATVGAHRQVPAWSLR